MSNWAGLRVEHGADRRRLDAFLAERARMGLPPFCPAARLGLWALLLHRIAHALHRRGRRFPARLVWIANMTITGADIDPAAEIGPGALIPNPRCVTIYGGAGELCTFGALVGIGGQWTVDATDVGGGPGRPFLRDGAVLDHGSLALGAFPIGTGAKVGPGTLVLAALPDGAEMRASTGTAR